MGYEGTGDEVITKIIKLKEKQTEHYIILQRSTLAESCGN